MTAKGRALSPIETRIADLEEKLAPATEGEIDHALAFLFANLPLGRLDDEDDADIRMEGYALACQGYPLRAICEARDAFIAGRVVGANKEFAPGPAVLGAEIARRVSHDRDKLTREKKQQAQAQDMARDERAPISDEARAYAARRVAELKAVSAAQRLEGTAPRGGAEDRFAPYRGALGLNGGKIMRMEKPYFPLVPLTPEQLADVPDLKDRKAMPPVAAFQPFKA